MPGRLVRERGASGGVQRLQRGSVRLVAPVPGGVDLREVDDAVPGQPYDQPLMPRPAAPAGFPALAHYPGQTGGNDVAGCGIVVLVAAGGYVGAVLQRGEVDGQALEERRIGYHLAVDAQPGYPAVREDVEPDVGGPECGADLEGVPGVTGHQDPRHDLLPGHGLGVPGDPLERGIPARRARVRGAGL